MWPEVLPTWTWDLNRDHEPGCARTRCLLLSAGRGSARPLRTSALRLWLVKGSQTASEQLQHVFSKVAKKFVQGWVQAAAQRRGAHLYGRMRPWAGLHLRPHETESARDHGRPPVPLQLRSRPLSEAFIRAVCFNVEHISSHVQLGSIKYQTVGKYKLKSFIRFICKVLKFKVPKVKVL